MANEPFYALLTDPGAGSYTVPAGKQAMFSAYFVDSSDQPFMERNGDPMAVFAQGAAFTQLVADEGDVLTCLGNGLGVQDKIGVVGLLIDPAGGTVFNAEINTVGLDTYTVPADTYAVFSATVIAVSGGIRLNIDGTFVAPLPVGVGGINQVTSFTAKAGEVISATVGGGSGNQRANLSGFLFPA